MSLINFTNVHRIWHENTLYDFKKVKIDFNIMELFPNLSA